MHELAHQRLHVLGIELENHDRKLLLNENKREFFSPIRRDVYRPMSALLHGILAWTFMLEVDLAAPDGTVYLGINVPKVRMGLATIKEFAVTTDEGQDFLSGFYAWADDAVLRGETALITAGVSETPVPGFQE